MQPEKRPTNKLPLSNAERQANYRQAKKNAEYELRAAHHNMQLTSNMLEKAITVIQQIKNGEKSSEVLETVLSHIDTAQWLIGPNNNKFDEFKGL